MKKTTIVMLAVLAGTVILNIVSWKSAAFSDWFVDHVFSYVSAPLSHFSDLFPFSLGEWMLFAAVLWILALVAILIFYGCLCIAGRSRRMTGQQEVLRKFLKTTCDVAIVVFTVMTLNCVILYHVTPLEEELPGYGKEYSIEELGALRDQIVGQCNRLSKLVPRDEDGEVAYAGGYGAMGQKARQAIANEAVVDGTIGTDDENERSTEEQEGAGKGISVLNRLEGWSVTPKGLLASNFVSQQYMQGYYFPFSMEANYNTVMKTSHVPSTMCHELSHTHGFIYEDEANLIGFLACIHSDDPVFQYSGWLSVLNYVDNSFYENVDLSEYRSHAAISDQVRADNEFLSEDSWQEVEEKAVVSTETAKAATDVYLDSTLKANGVESGKASYSHVVGLLLQYFDSYFAGS